MPFIPILNPQRYSQPQQVVRIAGRWRKGIAFAWIPSGGPNNLIGGASGTYGASGLIVPTRMGNALTGNGSVNPLGWTDAQALTTSDGAGTGDFAALCLAAFPSSAAPRMMFNQRRNAAGFPQFAFGHGFNPTNPDNTGSFANGDFTAYTYQTAYSFTPAIANGCDGNWHLYGARRVVAGGSATLYANVDNTSTNVSGASVIDNIYSSASDTAIGYRGEATTCRMASGDYIALCVAWNRFLSDDEWAQLVQNPWQLFEPVPTRIWVDAPAAGGVTGTLSKTQGANTISASGAVAIAASLSKTQGADSLASTGAIAVTGTLTATQGANSSTSTGAIAVIGTLTATQGADSLSSSGTVVTGATGSLEKTQGADSVASSGTVAIAGTAALSQGANTISSAGEISIVGAASISQAANTLSSSGSVGGGVTATANIVQGANAIASSGLIAIIGNASLAQAANTLSSSGAVLGDIFGTANILQAANTIASSAAIAVTGSASMTQDAQYMLTGGPSFYGWGSRNRIGTPAAADEFKRIGSQNA